MSFLDERLRVLSEGEAAAPMAAMKQVRVGSQGRGLGLGNLPLEVQSKEMWTAL